MIKVGIVGSRRRNSKKDKELIREVLERQLKQGKELHLVSGGCPEGADKFCEELSEELRLGVSIHYPDRSKLPSEPQYYHHVEMFYARNTLIAEECDILVALPHWDRKGGTENTISKVEEMKKPLIIL